MTVKRIISSCTSWSSYNRWGGELGFLAEGDFKLLKQQKCMELTVRVMLCIKGDRAGGGEGETHGRQGVTERP